MGEGVYRVASPEKKTVRVGKPAAGGQVAMHSNVLCIVALDLYDSQERELAYLIKLI